MNLAEAQEFRSFQAGDHSEYAGLLGKLQMILEADEVVTVRHETLEPQLDRGIGTFSRSGIDQTHRLHRAKPERIHSPAR